MTLGSITSLGLHLKICFQGKWDHLMQRFAGAGKGNLLCQMISYFPPSSLSLTLMICYCFTSIQAFWQSDDNLGHAQWSRRRFSFFWAKAMQTKAKRILQMIMACTTSSIVLFLRPNANTEQEEIIQAFPKIMFAKAECGSDMGACKSGKERPRFWTECHS